MAETRTTSTKAVEKRTTANDSDDLPGGVVEELAALRVIVEGTAHSTGAEFFQTLVRHLAQAVGAHYAFVAKCSSPGTRTRARTIALWSRDGIAENFGDFVLITTNRAG